MNPMLLDIPKEFESERLFLRMYKEGDGEILYNTMRTNRKHLEKIMPDFVLNVKSAREAEGLIFQLIADWYTRKRFVLGCWEKTTKNFVAEIYLDPINWNVPLVEIGYYVLKDYLGKGFATEAVNRTVKFAFQHLQMNKIMIRCDADNIASYKTAERCGFTKEGVLSKHSRNKEGLLVDQLCYGMTI